MEEGSKNSVSAFEQVLGVAVENGASDVHLVVDEPYLFRIGPDMIRCKVERISYQESSVIVNLTWEAVEHSPADLFAPVVATD